LYGELMSRIGKKPIALPDGVKVEQDGRRIKVSGPLGALEMTCAEEIKVTVADGQVALTNTRPELRRCRQMHGTMRALLANMVQGVTKGFEKKMEIYGTGYSVDQKGQKLVFRVGFANAVEMPIPGGVNVSIETPATRGNEVPAKFTLSSTDKHLLGQFAANIRRIRPPEPYQGKGIRYADEQVRRKVGKAFASGPA